MRASCVIQRYTNTYHNGPSIECAYPPTPWLVLDGQVVLVASQDLSIGRWADMTVFLEDGSVSEAGRWDDMLANGGSFAAAVREHDAF